MGIDPGTNIMGYALIVVKNKKPQLLVSGCLVLNKITDPYLKLKKIFQRTLQVIDEYKPDELAIESQFFGKNVQSMLKLGRAQGVAISAALERDIPITEYAPRKIKLAVTGSGTASKEQIASILQRYFKITKMPDNFDETDAMAIAMCHFFQKDFSITNGTTKTMTKKMTTKKSSSWADFVKSNPNRVKKSLKSVI